MNIVAPAILSRYLLVLLCCTLIACGDQKADDSSAKEDTDSTDTTLAAANKDAEVLEDQTEEGSDFAFAKQLAEKARIRQSSLPYAIEGKPLLDNPQGLLGKKVPPKDYYQLMGIADPSEMMLEGATRILPHLEGWGTFPDGRHFVIIRNEPAVGGIVFSHSLLTYTPEGDFFNITSLADNHYVNCDGTRMQNVKLTPAPRIIVEEKFIEEPCGDDPNDPLAPGEPKLVEHTRQTYRLPPEQNNSGGFEERVPEGEEEDLM